MEIKSIKIQSDFNNLKKWSKKFQSLTASALASPLRQHLLENYTKSKNFDGGMMAKLRPSTIIQKLRAGSSTATMPLIFTGQLSRAITQTDLNPTKSILFVDDKVRKGGITNTGILSRQKLLGREPFGLGAPGIAVIRKRIAEIMGAGNGR